MIIQRIINNKIIKRISLVITIVMIFTITLSRCFGATDPTLVTKVNSALKKIQSYLVKIALPAAGVAIASGVLIRKFSFGNEEKMVIGKKIIVNAILRVCNNYFYRYNLKICRFNYIIWIPTIY